MRRISACALLASAFLAGVLLVAASSALAQSTKSLPALTQTSPDALTRALAKGEITPAKYALERALSLFRPAHVEARYGAIARPYPRSATLILRDLAIRVGDLTGADRERALAILARPTDGKPSDPDGYTTAEATPVCGTNVCIHYVTTTADAVAGTDTTPSNGIPDYVDLALQTFQNEVWATEVTTMGYRAPKSDVTSDNNGSSSVDLTGTKFDVYLANLGDDFLYGYCTTDDPHFDHGSHYNFFDASAYCVVDNDFAEPIFSNHTAPQNLQVTAAHEFFHAVQFSYDAFEDQWILEASATWMEDEIYDDVNDSLQYLHSGPLGKPHIPLDRSSISQTDFHVYGDWIFFRYLSETFNPGLVRLIWNRADASEDTDAGGPDGIGPDDYSIQAVARVLSSRGGFRSRFAAFGWMNRVARVPDVYEEGDENHYPQSPLTDPANTLSKSSPSRSKSPKLDHQTNAYYEFKRGSGFSSTAKLKVILNLPGRSTGSAASVLVYKKNGDILPLTLGITRAGDGAFKVPFGSGVAKVGVILTNASTRYVGSSCFSFSTPFACGGALPRDDNKTYALKARV